MATKKYLITEDELEYLDKHLEENIPYPSAHVTKIRKRQYSGKNIEAILRPDVLHFALDMEKKLRKHDNDRGKRGWVNENMDDKETKNYLYDRLNEEMIELRKEMFLSKLENNRENTANESVDVGNFAMMIHSTNIGLNLTKENSISELIEELNKDPVTKSRKSKYEYKPVKKESRFENLIE
jgi:hypothetical protein